MQFGARKGQTVPQKLQLFGSLSTFVSQPSTGIPLQSAKPELQLLIWHMPALQDGVALAKLQKSPHMPQLLVSEVVLASQPSAALTLQSL